jgi:hypothetical protein
VIEILVVRNPDMADEIRVWIDGEEMFDSPDKLVSIYVDAGAGWDYEDWIESADAELERARSDTFR